MAVAEQEGRLRDTTQKHVVASGALRYDSGAYAVAMRVAAGETGESAPLPVCE